MYIGNIHVIKLLFVFLLLSYLLVQGLSQSRSRRGRGKIIFLSYYICVCCCLVTKSCLPLLSLPGSSDHGASQVRILGWMTVSFSRGSSWPGIEPASPALAGRFFTTDLAGKLINIYMCVCVCACVYVCIYTFKSPFYWWNFGREGMGEQHCRERKTWICN